MSDKITDCQTIHHPDPTTDPGVSPTAHGARAWLTGAMIARTLALVTAGLLGAAALTGCVRLGPMGSETAAPPGLDDVTAVVLDTSGDLVVTEGEPALTIHAPEGILERLTADVHDGVLELGRRGGPLFGGGGEIRYELSLPRLDSIEVNGSGDVEAPVSGGALRIEISGSGDVEVTGTADSLDIEISGSGEVEAGELVVRDASVEISGSGDADLDVTGTLVVDISGSGTVTHRGGAEVTAEVSGSGSVEQDD